jgi:hypothetical protein
VFALVIGTALHTWEKKSSHASATFGVPGRGQREDAVSHPLLVIISHSCSTLRTMLHRRADSMILGEARALICDRSLLPEVAGNWKEEEKKQTGDHAIPQEGFGLDTLEVAQGGRATTGITGRGRQGERTQGSVHQISSKLTGTSRHGRSCNRSPNQKDIAGKNRAHSSTNRVGTSGPETERIQEPRHARTLEHRKGKRVNMQCLEHARGSCKSFRRDEIQETKPHTDRIRASRRKGLAAGKEMLDAALAAFHQGVPPQQYLPVAG